MLPSVAPAKAGIHWKRLDAGRRDDGKYQTIGLETLPFGKATLVAPAKAGIHWKRPDAGRRRGDGYVSNHPIGNAALVAPAKAGSHWKRPGAGAGGGGGGGGDGKCQTIGLETLPSSRRRKPAFTGNARMPAGGGVTGTCQTIRLETLGAGAGGRLAGGTGLVV